MPVKYKCIPRAKMSAREREVRSRLVQILSSKAYVRGSLVYRERICGNPNCKCNRGEKHPAINLDINDQGHHRQIFLPKTIQDQVKQWVELSQKVRQLLEELSRIHWKKIQKREV